MEVELNRVRERIHEHANMLTGHEFRLTAAESKLEKLNDTIYCEETGVVMFLDRLLQQQGQRSQWKSWLAVAMLALLSSASSGLIVGYVLRSMVVAR